jgi:hypothetical protein
MVPTWSEAAGFLRLIRGLGPFLAQTITFEQARETIGRAMRSREQRFLSKLEATVFSCPKSPYFQLLQSAGCDPGDVRRLVREEGIEGTLDRLRQAGVFVIWEEFKGRKSICRGSRTFAALEKDFDNPVVREHYTSSSGGTSGRPARVRIDIEELASPIPGGILENTLGWAPATPSGRVRHQPE